MVAVVRVQGIAACGYFYPRGVDRIADRPRHHKLQDRKGHACEPCEFAAPGVEGFLKPNLFNHSNNQVYHGSDPMALLSVVRQGTLQCSPLEGLVRRQSLLYAMIF